MGIVLSHTTAKAVYQAAYSVAVSAAEPVSNGFVLSSQPNRQLIDDAANWLASHGVRTHENTPLEITVFKRDNAHRLSGCLCHVSTKRFSSSRFIKLTDDIAIVSVELCALQAASHLPFRELVEYYFELCGAYSLKGDGSTSYIERPALTSTAKLKHFFSSLTSCDGLVLARKAIAVVRDGCRSPMETAFVMMLTLPKREGGLGIKGVETDYEVSVTNVAKSLTRRTKFFMDAYLKKSRTDIEYNGFHHDTEENQAIDEERKNALAAMGYDIITVSKHSFMHAKPFARVMEAIQRKEGIRPSRLPENFGVKQDELRKFVLRRFFEEQEKAREKIRRDRKERKRIDYEKAQIAGTLDDPTINTVIEPNDMQIADYKMDLGEANDIPAPEGKVYGLRIASE